MRAQSNISQVYNTLEALIRILALIGHPSLLYYLNQVYFKVPSFFVVVLVALRFASFLLSLFESL